MAFWRLVRRAKTSKISSNELNILLWETGFNVKKYFKTSKANLKVEGLIFSIKFFLLNLILLIQTLIFFLNESEAFPLQKDENSINFEMKMFLKWYQRNRRKKKYFWRRGFTAFNFLIDWVMIKKNED